MSFWMKKTFTLATLCFVAAAVGSGCTKSTPQPQGAARISVSSRLTSADVASVRLTVKDGGNAPLFTDIVTTLTKNGNAFTGTVTGIPAGPGRVFLAEALNASNQVIFSGSATATIVAGQSASVTIIMQESTSNPFHNSLPQINSLTASTLTVASAGLVSVDVGATDPDNDPLTYAWADNCTGSFNPNNTHNSAWTAPNTNTSCTLSITVADNRGGSTTGSFVIQVGAGNNGSAGVSATTNSFPVITGMSATATFTSGGTKVEADITVNATDPDGNPLTYSWASTCNGTFTAPTAATTHFTNAGDPTHACTVTVSVSDGTLITTGQVVIPPRTDVTVGGPCVGKVQGDACDDGNACTTGTVCQANGTCGGGTPVVCQGTACRDPGTCDPANGQCSVGAPKPNTTACDDSNACSINDHCDGNGTCVGGGNFCPAGQTCNPVGPTCTAPPPAVVAQLAKRLDLSTSVGLGIDTAGNSYVTGTLVTPTKTFDGTNLTSAGAGDAFIGSYDASGTLRWVINYGDASDQQPAGLAVGSVAGNTVLANGRFSGAIGSVNAGAATWDYLLFLNAGSGAITASRSIDTDLTGAIFAVGANPNLDLFAVCGKAGKLALDTSAGAPGTTWATVAGANTFGGATDIVIGLYDKAGTKLWAKQIGTAADEECDSIAIDDLGNVIAAGKYSGSGNLTLAGATPLPNPGSTFRKHIWVAKFDGTTGAGMSQKSFGGGAGSHQVYGIAFDGSGNIFIAGSFSNTLPFDGTHSGASACAAGAAGCLVSDGASDGFVAKLDGSFNPLWITRIGVNTADDLIKGVAVDSNDNPTVGGLLNGSATWASLTPTTVQTASVADPNLTSAGGSASSFIAKLAGATGAFSSSLATVTGNATASNTNHVAINAKGAGTVKDAVSFSGEFAGGTLNFGSSAATTITSPSGASTFLVFAKEQ